ncbi:peroxide-responsive transcriptional repressor PerRA [Leptospira noguchii]|uniref:Ferric uptake regulator family protein n=2 Tax=Leptospira noguchii TaxID=28182 RepID=T0FHM4_9LEPT|nr:Fur family transcriptional regulator [Leptospira noguchii]EMO54379.1 ferric uptake regulator family protein [Leptospira noguchii]EQA72833.1 ferric uptake regulator family protein [Leptospira noguchii serovar Panama str. CZ214]
MKDSYERSKKILEDAGINVTVQRLQMANLLLSKPQHLTADQVFQLINEHIPNASRATIFNNLKLFAEKGIVNLLELKSGITLYDSNVIHHHHAIDEETGEIYDISLDFKLQEKVLSELKQDFKLKTGSSLENCNLSITLKGKKNP